MKTIHEHLSQLPDGYRELALANLLPRDKDVPEETASDALESAFVWNDTPQGHGFWSDASRALKRGTPLPPLQQ